MWNCINVSAIHMINWCDVQSIKSKKGKMSCYLFDLRQSLAGVQYIIFSVTDTLTTHEITYHGIVILVRERIQIWIERNRTHLVSYCEELTILCEGSTNKQLVTMDTAVCEGITTLLKVLLRLEQLNTCNMECVYVIVQRALGIFPLWFQCTDCVCMWIIVRCSYKWCNRE